MRLCRRYSTLLLAVALSAQTLVLHAQQIEALRLNSPQYEAEAAKLRAAPRRPYEFAKAMLGDVIRFLATDAGISFFSLPDGSPEADRLITFSLNASPFQSLETLCKANSLALVLDGGIWYVRPADDKELMGRAYEIKNNSFEKITKNGTGSSSGTGGSAPALPGGSGATGSSGTAGSTGGMEGAAGGSAGGTGVDLQGSTQTFVTQRSELINDIRAILDLPPDNGNGGSEPVTATPASATLTPEAAAAANLPLDIYGNVRKPKVLWKSDSNTLYVVATRLQHMWVEGYLAAADKPQALIALEVKFFETSRDPSSELGLDWTGTFGQTGTFRQPTSITTDSTGLATLQTTDVTNSAGGYRTDFANLLTLNNLNTASTTFHYPTQAILSAQDVSVSLRAMLTDQKTKTVSYPRMVTTNNREVAIRSVINQPVLGGSSSTSLGGGATTTSAISYLPIGTSINILPKKMMEDRVNLNISITVSSIISTAIIQGNPYPVASSRVFGAPVEVNSGYTVAIGGIDEAKEQETDTGIPFLNKIPVLGYLFKTHNKTKDQKHMLIFITPKLVDCKDGGLPEHPEAAVPRKPDALMPKVPHILADGSLQGGINALPNAVAFMERSSREIQQTIEESRDTEEEWKKIKELQEALKRLEKSTDRYITENPAHWDELNHAKWQIQKIMNDNMRARTAMIKKGYY
jgi:hypothetical protein